MATINVTADIAADASVNVNGADLSITATSKSNGAASAKPSSAMGRFRRFMSILLVATRHIPCESVVPEEPPASPIVVCDPPTSMSHLIRGALDPFSGSGF